MAAAGAAAVNSTTIAQPSSKPAAAAQASGRRGSGALASTTEAKPAKSRPPVTAWLKKVVDQPKAGVARAKALAANSAPCPLAPRWRARR